MTKIVELLAERIGKQEIGMVTGWAKESAANREQLYSLAISDNASGVSSQDGQERVATNALWCLTHLRQHYPDWLQSKQDELIDHLLVEQRTDRKRMLLQLLREQSFSKETLRADFLDFCLGKINSECETYAIRAFCIYCAYNQCRHYPELVAELEQYLNLLSTQSLSPGLQCALRTVRRHLSRN